MAFSLFAVSLAAIVIIYGLTLCSWLTGKLKFWPPPNLHCWQYRTFWALFRVFVLCLVATSIVDFQGLGVPSLIQASVGLALAVVGFGAAFSITFNLGWRTAHGDPDKLKTTGAYAWSRNPIYVASVVGMVGTGLFVHSTLVYILLSLWALGYLAVPFVEEVWLEAHFGDSFRQYKSRVNRFFGRRVCGPAIPDLSGGMRKDEVTFDD